MKLSKGPRAAAGTSKRRPVAPRSTDRRLILLDQGPLRSEAVSECGREMARLEKAKAEWKRYEKEDKAAFSRWMAATFGALMSRLRETSAVLSEREALLHEVEQQLFSRRSRTPKTAYAAVMKRRALLAARAESTFRSAPRGDQRTETESKRPRSHEAEPEEAQAQEGPDELGEHEEKLLFEQYARTVLGLNPQRLSRAKYDQMFAEFKETVLKAAQEKLKSDGERAADEPPPEDETFPAPPPVAISRSARVKELYRLLVRRLHPDLKADSDAEVSAVWHDVQEAYGQGNVERLEMLLAFTEVQANEVGDQTSLYQMRSLWAELRRSYNALLRNLRDAKKDPAWNFSQLKNHSALARRIRAGLESNLEWQESEVQRIDAMVDGWKAPAKRKKKAGDGEKPKTRKKQVVAEVSAAVK